MYKSPKRLDEARHLVSHNRNYAELLHEGNPLIAQVLLEKKTFKHLLLQTPKDWLNHEGNLISSTLLMHAIEIALSTESYENVMKFFLKNNLDKDISNLAVDYLQKRMWQDKDFSNQISGDEVLLPIFFSHHETAKASFPSQYLKPLSHKSQCVLDQDKIKYLEFDANQLSSFQKDILAIQNLLSNKSLMMKQLASLEHALNDEIKIWHPEAKLPLERLVGRDYRMFNKPYLKKKGHSFFYDFFKTWAMNNDFNGIVKLFEAKSNTEFRETIKSGNVFKDVAFGGELHGAWTHLIQWYCIVNAYNTGDLVLEATPAEIYSEIGASADEENTLWDVTFESPKSDFPLIHDYRSVGQFHLAMIHDDDFAMAFPTLQAMLYYRALKDDERQDKLLELK